MKFAAQSCFECLLRHQCIFSYLTESEQNILNKQKVTKTALKDQYIFYEGWEASNFVVLHSGLVKKSVQLKDGTECAVDIKESGDVTGLEAMSLNAVYTTSVSCISNTMYCLINRETMMRFFRNNTKVCDFLANSFVESIASKCHRIVEVTVASSKARLAKILILFRDSHNVKNTIELTREELAGLSGVTRETVSRNLSFFRKRGLVSIKGKTIRIANPAGLRKLLADRHLPAEKRTKKTTV